MARLGQAALGLVALRLVTHYLTVDQFGLLGLMTALTGFFGLFLINPVGQHVSRHTHDWHQQGVLLDQLKRYNHYLICLAIITFILAGTWYGARTGWTAHMANQLGIAVVLSLTVWLGTWNATLVPMLNMLGHRAGTAALSMLTVAAGLVMSALLINWQAQATFWLAGQLVGLACGALPALHMLRREEPTTPTAVRSAFLDRTTLQHYCLPLAMATGLMWLLGSGYRFFVDAVWGARDLGLLVLGLAVAAQFWAIIENVAGQVVYPKYYCCLSRENDTDKRNAFNQMVNVVIPSYLILLGLGLATAPHLLVVLADLRFANASQLCSIAMLIEAMRATTNVITQAAQIERKTASMIFPYLVGVVSAVIGFGVLYLMKATVIWVPWILAFAMLCVLVTAVYKMHQIAPIYPDRKNWLLALLAGLIVILLTFSLQASSMAGHISVLFISGTLSLCALLWVQKRSKAFHALMAVRLPAERSQGI
ncbi:polysaccharide biosynthesis protein [Pseudogulbenkiania ferrooxidans]|nr:hypothetical protein [Pseudogulbenkiania ferrooxidans]